MHGGGGYFLFFSARYDFIFIIGSTGGKIEEDEEGEGQKRVGEEVYRYVSSYGGL